LRIEGGDDAFHVLGVGARQAGGPAWQLSNALSPSIDDAAWAPDGAT
jgi:hypothetical protein